jgi:hypothetical protein
MFLGQGRIIKNVRPGGCYGWHLGNERVVVD